MFILIGLHVRHFSDGNQTVCPTLKKKINHGLSLGMPKQRTYRDETKYKTQSGIFPFEQILCKCRDVLASELSGFKQRTQKI
jgi:hypothetical protein